ncbi:hypothetical protein ACVIIW_001211 [Bradyrhizobium sp. USDA 4449]
MNERIGPLRPGLDRIRRLKSEASFMNDGTGDVWVEAGYRARDPAVDPRKRSQMAPKLAERLLV